MSIKDIKKELHSLIDNTDDEQVLNVVKEELVAYQTGEFNIDDLNPEDRAELEEQDEEHPFKDTITYEEFQQHIKEWRSQLLQKRDSKTK